MLIPTLVCPLNRYLVDLCDTKSDVAARNTVLFGSTARAPSTAQTITAKIKAYETWTPKNFQAIELSAAPRLVVRAKVTSLEYLLTGGVVTSLSAANKGVFSSNPKIGESDHLTFWDSVCNS
jgi:hypothetical protein